MIVKNNQYNKYDSLIKHCLTVFKYIDLLPEHNIQIKM